MSTEAEKLFKRIGDQINGGADSFILSKRDVVIIFGELDRISESSEEQYQVGYNDGWDDGYGEGMEEAKFAEAESG